MKEKIYALTEQDQSDFEGMRHWLLAHFNGDIREIYKSVEGKIYIVDSIFRSRSFTADNVFELLALGVGLGDAIAQAKGLEWVIVEDQDGRVPELKIPGKNLKVRAFTAIQKRVAFGEDFAVADLFNSLCEIVDQIAAPPKSFWQRLFGPRLA